MWFHDHAVSLCVVPCRRHGPRARAARGPSSFVQMMRIFALQSAADSDTQKSRTTRQATDHATHAPTSAARRLYGERFT